MKLFRIATVSLNQTPLDWKGNTDRILSALQSLSQIPDGKPDLILFPELSITGYGCEDTFHSLDVSRRSYEKLYHIADRSRSILPDTLIFLGLPVRHNDFIYNSMAVIHNGEVVGVIPKQNLAGDGVHYEPRWFAAYRGKSPDSVELGDKKLPFGSLLLEFRGVKIGVEICEDAWVAARPALPYMVHGTDIILNPSASHFAIGKQNIRRNIALESSRSLCTLYVMVNLLGNEAGRMLYEGNTIVASNGELLYESERFGFSDLRLNVLDVDVNINRVQRSRIYSYREQKDVHPHESEHMSHIVIRSPETRLTPGFASQSNTEIVSNGVHPNAISTFKHNYRAIPHHLTREEEFLYSVTLALFDYMRKTHSQGFVLSLSGGADSTTIALLLHRMVLYALHELGPEALFRRLNMAEQFKNVLETPPVSELKTYFQENSPLSKEGETYKNSLNLSALLISGRVIHTIYQSSANSSQTTRQAAAAVAGAIGSDHHEFSINDVVSSYTNGIQDILDRELKWETDDLAMQNIQARARSPMAWFLANTTGSLLLTTSNRSEAAVGYCTMDGDTSGGLAPIAGVSKDFIRKWLRYMETAGDRLGGPVRELELINDQAPTAELRPMEKNRTIQTDEADLMPYDILDIIEKLAVRDRKSPLDIYKFLQNDPDYSNQPLKLYIRRFFSLWSRNQWKRERYAPSFHLDDENLDPRTWYRFPILSGGYFEELNELDEL